MSKPSAVVIKTKNNSYLRIYLLSLVFGGNFTGRFFITFLIDLVNLLISLFDGFLVDLVIFYKKYSINRSIDQQSSC